MGTKITQSMFTRAQMAFMRGGGRAVRSMLGSRSPMVGRGSQTPGDVTLAMPFNPRFYVLDDLQDDATYGDLTWDEDPFEPGEFVVLLNDQKAHWDGNSWSAGAAVAADANDITNTMPFLAELFANLAALAGDEEVGDGEFTGDAFDADQYIVLGDASQANWDGLVWAEGPAE